MLALVVAAAYCNSFGIGFRFDDWHVLEQNPAIRSLRSIPRFFVDWRSTTVLRENAGLRPLLMTTFALNYAISGAAPWSYHLFNVVLHWCVAVLIFRIVRDHLWLGDDALPIAAAAALIVAVHPLNTEPLDYLSARSALLTTACYVGAFAAVLRSRRILTVLLFVAALLSKEIAISFPAVVLAYWLIDRRYAAHRSRFQLSWPFVALLVALAAAAVAYRLVLLPPWAFETAHAAADTPWIYCMTEWSAYLYYARLFLWPNALVVDRLDYPRATSIVQLQAWGSLLALSLVVVLAWRLRRSAPAIPFALAWIALTLATESSIFPLAEPVNEHRPYLAMLGFAAIAAIGIWHAGRRVASRLHAPPIWVFAVVVTFITTALGAVTLARNDTWRDDYTLWIDATQKAPRNPRAWLNAGRAAMAQGRDADARRLLLQAHALAPCYAYVQLNLSALAGKAGALQESLTWADDAVRCNTGFALTHYYRAAALDRLHRGDEALDEYRRTTEIDPQHTAAWLAQGRILEERSDWRAAAAAYDAALQADPLSFDAAMRAGLVYHHHLQQPALAVERYRTVLRLMPTHYGAHYQLAVALLAAGDQPGAQAAWRAFVPLAAAIGDRASVAAAPALLRDSK